MQAKGVAVDQADLSSKRAARPARWRSTPWLGGLVISVIVALAAFDIWRGYVSAVAETQRELGAMSHLLAGQTARSLQQADRITLHIADDYRAGKLDALGDEAALHDYLHHQAFGLVQVAGLSIIDAHGRVHASSSRYPLPVDAVAQSPVFEQLKARHDSTIVVAHAMRGIASPDPWFVPMVRRLQTQDGRFAGAVTDSGRVEFFQDLYRDLRLGERGIEIALLDRDGALLARQPTVEPALRGRSSDLFDAMPAARGLVDQAASRSATPTVVDATPTAPPARSIPVRYRSPIDGVERFGAVQTLAGYPLAVLVSRDASAALAPWRAEAIGTGLRTLAFGVLAIVLLLLVRGAQGQPLRIAGSVTDIDARRRAEDALRLSQERLALAMAGSTGGHWVWDTQSDALFVSDTVNQLFGLPAELHPPTRREYFGHICVHPADQGAVRQVEVDVLNGRTMRFDIEYRIVLPDGALRWILTRAQAFHDDAGRPSRVAGVSADITQRKHTEEALRLSEQRFALAVAGSNDGILDWDLVNDRMYTSERLLQMLGLPTGVTLRTRAEWSALQVVHPQDRERHTLELRRFIAGRETLRAGEYRLRRPDGSCFWARVRNLCVRDADGRALRLAGSVSDVDAYKRVEVALRESEERYALAMTGSNEGHWVWDLRAGQVFISARMAELVAIAGGAQVMSDTSYFERLQIHPDDAERARLDRERHVAGETPRLDHEFRIVRPDTHEVRWLHTRGQCFRDPQGCALRMAGAAVDATQRKSDEQALRASEERFALAVDGSDDGVWDFDYVHGRIFCSRRARQILGVAVEPEVQAIDEWYRSVHVHPDDAPGRDAAIRATLEGSTPAYEAEWRVCHPDGSWRWVRTRGVCVRDPQGRPLRSAGSVSDIDARKRAVQALSESEERFALALAGSNDGILDWDIAGDRMFASARAWQLIGLPPEEGLLTRAQWAARVMPRFHHDELARVNAEFDDHLRRPPESHEGEYRLLGADGEYHWLRLRGRLVHDAAGTPVRWAGSISDIDALKKTECALRRSQERYQLAVDGSNEGLWDWDLDDDSLFLSPRAQQLLWQRQGEAQRPRREWIAITDYHPDDVPVVRAALSAHLRGESAHFKVEYRLRHHSGEWHWYRQRGVAVRDARGRPLRMAGSMEDITDRKRAEAERERLEVQLRQAQKLESIGTLAGGIAHDFNNILAAILGYGEMAQKIADEGSVLRHHIDAAMSAGLRAKSLVERILAFSRSGVGERVPVHVQSVVAEALDAVAASLPRGIRLERRLDAGNAAVLGDPTQVHQVVMNLCANAVQAMKDSGTLSVALEHAQCGLPHCATAAIPGGNCVRLHVSDTGSGMAQPLLERIFDPFFTTKEVGVGTGLGLSLVHGIVTDLGGGIDVDSVVGRGSTFTIFLPWQSWVAPPESVDQPLPLGKGETVLLVDDEETLVRLGEVMIAGLGYEPIGFTSGGAALRSFSEAPGRFDLVLSDEAMPEMTGSDLARSVRSIRADIPILLMSGYVTPALTRNARDAGVVDVLAKPLVERDIARSLAEALQRRL